MSGFGQVKIAELTFEAAGGYTTSISECTDSGGDYFIRTDGTNIGASFNSVQGTYYFAAQDIDAAGCPAASGANATLLLNDINIAGYTNLELRVHIAEDDDGANQDWDTSDFMHIDYDIDNATTYSNLLWVESSGATNTVPSIDTDYDGLGDGSIITDTFTQFINSIAGTGNLLDIRVTFDLDSGDEDIAIDNIEIWGVSSCTPPADPIGNISGTTPACNSTTLTYTGTTIPGTVDYWQTTATGTSTANNATGTFNATATGTYYVRTFLTATSCWSAGAASYAVVINSAPTISGQPADATSVIPNTATFSVTATGSPAPTYQWQVNSGLGWANVTGGTGATTDTYTTGATSAPMNNNQYRCVVTNTCGSATSNTATLSLSNSSPSNAQNLTGCFEDNSVILTWNNPATPPTGGYVIFAIEGTTDPTAPPNDANTYTANSNFSAATFETPATLGKVVYKGNGTTAIVTGLTENSTYSFRIFAYNGEALTGWANGSSGGSNDQGIAQADVRNLVATSLTNQVNLNWNNPLPSSCFEQLIIVANEGPVVFTPSGTYPNSDVDYSTPNSIVYSTTSTVSVNAIGGLTNGTNYCFKVFIRRGSVWSEGVEVCAVPSLTYCTSNGDGTDGFFTLINNVEFNTINNSSPVTVDNAYSDFTSISTTVTLGETYNLDVRVETDGAYTTTARAWIDWNNDGDFSDSNEVYELGNAYNVIDGSTDASPLAIEVPTNAVIAATRMRISNRYGTNASTPCQTGFDGEVEDYTINVVQPTTAEINIKGNNITIPSGFNDAANGGLNQTLFGSTNVGAAGPIKTYDIENIGATTLNLTGTPRVDITGANPGDFTVTLQPNATVGSLSSSSFNIQFFPTADGVRTATVTIQNSDSDENPYTFAIQGTAVCSTSATSSIWPENGPENTEVTITSVNDLTGATATINGLAMTTVSSSSSELIVLVPANATSGNINVQFTTGCSSNNAFTVIDNMISGCQTATASTLPTDLFISEVSDATSGSSSFIEIFNGTGSSVDLTDYSIRVFNNGSGTPSTTANLTGTLASGSTHVISIGTTSCDLTGNGLSGGLPNQTFNSAGGINFDINSSDMIELYNSITATPIDYFGVSGSNNWANGLVLGGDGVNFRRQNTATNLPDLSFDINDWNQIDWTDCNDSDYSDFGVYDFSLGIPPTVSLMNSPTFDCTNSIQLSVSGTEGVSGGLGLAYQWYYLAPNTNAFVLVPNTADFNNITTNATLDIINPIPYLDYQFYCQVRENSTTCFTASNAIKLEAITAVWTSSSWSSTPTSSKIVIINDDYDTNVNTNGETSFEACQLFVTAGNLLTIHEGDYVEVINNVEVFGNGTGNDGIIVLDKGSFVQRGDDAAAGTFTLNTNGASKVNKRTAPLNNYYEYTYWSSPVLGETIGTGLAEGHPTRRYKFEADNYLDSTMETNNNNASVSGQDDIDDNGDDWVSTPSGETMQPGIGYAAMHDPIGFTIVGGQYEYIFEGAFNTGDIDVTIYRNDAETNDNNWNFIGNPYPSAIDADLFLAANTVIAQDVEEFPTGSGVTNGAIFLWSQSTAPSGTANGNQNLNFAQSDYAIINATGQTAGGDNDNDGDIDIDDQPDRFIPSGQGFFISYSNSGAVDNTNGDIRSGTVSFTNSMRVTGNNNQFFRTGNTNESNKLWVNMSSDNGVRNQILIGYVEGATDGLDDMCYDAPKNLSTGVHAMIYTTVENSNKQLAIQGKAPSSLNLDEIIPLGFYTGIEDATLYTISIDFLGEFFEENSVYLKDNELEIIHDLTISNYTFTSNTGTFNNRFEIVFNPNALSVDENISNTNSFSIIELEGDNVMFKLKSSSLTITDVDIIDLLGRTIYKFKGSSNTEVYNLSNLSSATYLTKVTLSNGQIITKKAVKK